MDVWNANINEVLFCQLEENNAMDKYAIKVIKNDTIVGHVPAEISKLVHFFLKRGGEVIATVTGSYQNNGKGLEVPVDYQFKGIHKDTVKLERLLLGSK